MPKTNLVRSHGPESPKNTLPPPKRIVNRSLPPAQLLPTEKKKGQRKKWKKQENPKAPKGKNLP